MVFSTASADVPSFIDSTGDTSIDIDIEPLSLHRSATPTSVSTKRRPSFMAYENTHSNHFHVHALSDPATTPARLISTFFNAILATALFGCWHILLFYLGWATMVVLVNEKVTSLTFSPTLLTVVGTVLGFVVSYRTTSSFERYNEGRRYWSQIILGSRTLARAVWFHVPELPNPPTPEDEKLDRSEDERRARNLVEKKTVINLIEAFAVAVKHYLRGEEGIAYVDLYHLVKFLPSYAFPAGVIPSDTEAHANMARTQSYRDHASVGSGHAGGEGEREASEATVTATGVETRMEQGVGATGLIRPSISVELAPPEPALGGANGYSSAAPRDGSNAVHPQGPNQPHVTLDLPLPATAPNTTQRQRGLSFRSSISRTGRSRSYSGSSQRTFSSPGKPKPPHHTRRAPTYASASDDAVTLLPASLPPTNSVFDVFPFSLFVKLLENRGTPVEGKKAAKMRAKTVVVTRNVPLEISMYLTSYVATLGARKVVDVPTNNLLIFSVNQLTDALTGLERILTTPIPFSYSIHLWLVTIIYNLALPFQIYATLRWLTIPASGVMSFIFFGFLVAGEEIENPFGYDKNDLNMDHFTRNIIRNELRALTAFPPPAPEVWAFSARNDRLFTVSDPFLSSHVNIPALNKDQDHEAGLEKDGEKGEKGDKELEKELDRAARNAALAQGQGGHVGVGIGLPGGVAGVPTFPAGAVGNGVGSGLTPEGWVRRGTFAMRDALSRAH